MLLIGAGGLGSPLIMYLAAAGVGTIGIIDDDTVSLSNLQRQIAHDTPHVGAAQGRERPRHGGPPQSARDASRPSHARIDAGNALDIIARYDIVADGSDNFATRYLVSDACYLARKPLVFAAVGPFDGYVTTFKPHETRPRRHALARATAACSRRRRPPAPSPTAPRSACSAPWSASSARCRRRRC